MITITEREYNALCTVAQALAVDPDVLYRLIELESGWDPLAKNPHSSARGLIQFVDSSAQELGYMDAADLVEENPSREKQLLGPVYHYLEKYKPFPTNQSLYMAVFYPKFRFVEPTTAFPQFVQGLNPGINTVQDYIDLVEGRTIAASILEPIKSIPKPVLLTSGGGVAALAFFALKPKPRG